MARAGERQVRRLVNCNVTGCRHVKAGEIFFGTQSKDEAKLWSNFRYRVRQSANRKSGQKQKTKKLNSKNQVPELDQNQNNNEIMLSKVRQ